MPNKRILSKGCHMIWGWIRALLFFCIVFFFSYQTTCFGTSYFYHLWYGRTHNLHFSLLRVPCSFRNLRETFLAEIIDVHKYLLSLAWILPYSKFLTYMDLIFFLPEVNRFNGSLTETTLNIADYFLFLK